MEYEHHNSFSLTDPKTRKCMDLNEDFGGVIINTNETTYDRECMPQMNIITDKNDNQDGETFIDAKYGTRIIDMTIFLQDEGNDLSRLKMWLNKPHQQWFEWEHDWGLGLYVIETGGWKSQVFYGKKFNGKIDLKFIAHSPFYTFRKGKEYPRIYSNPKINEPNRMGTIANVKSFPIIKITPNGTQATIQFKWNENLIVTLNNVDKPIYLDTQKETCYEMNGSILIPTPLKFYSDVYYHYPYIDPDISNYFTILQGDLLEVSIEHRARII